MILLIFQIMIFKLKIKNYLIFIKNLVYQIFLIHMQVLDLVNYILNFHLIMLFMIKINFLIFLIGFHFIILLCDKFNYF